MGCENSHFSFPFNFIKRKKKKKGWPYAAKNILKSESCRKQYHCIVVTSCLFTGSLSPFFTSWPFMCAAESGESGMNAPCPPNPSALRDVSFFLPSPHPLLGSLCRGKNIYSLLSTPSSSHLMVYPLPFSE